MSCESKLRAYIRTPGRFKEEILLLEEEQRELAVFAHNSPVTGDPMSIKLVAVGDKAANKTVLLIRYCKGEAPTGYVPTVFDAYSVTVSCSTKCF